MFVALVVLSRSSRRGIAIVGGRENRKTALTSCEAVLKELTDWPLASKDESRVSTLRVLSAQENKQDELNSVNKVIIVQENVHGRFILKLLDLDENLRIL